MFADVAINITLETGALQTTNSNHALYAGAPLTSENDLTLFHDWRAILDGEQDDEKETCDCMEDVCALLNTLNNNVTAPNPSTSHLT